MSDLSVAVWTVVIIAASAFFVAAEFSLMSARSYRLEEAARTSAAARAAVRNSAELTLLLAGSQLGITVCTLALGAITKPAVHHALMPLLALTGLPVGVPDAVAFGLALLIVTFLHLVVGEMAPKSWAIAHPERSAILLALPMRAFMAVTRPLLRALNAAANWLVRRAGAEPVDELNAGQNPEGLRHLVVHSANVGALDVSFRAPLEGALTLREETLADVLGGDGIVSVGPSATVADVHEQTRLTGHRRILVRSGERTVGVVHVRDTLEEGSDAPAASNVRQPLVLDASTRLHEALRAMKDTRTHLVIVTDQGREVGVASIADILPRLLPEA